MAGKWGFPAIARSFVKENYFVYHMNIKKEDTNEATEKDNYKETEIENNNKSIYFLLYLQTVS